MTATASRLKPEPSTRGRTASPAGPTTTLSLLPIGADLLPRAAGATGRGRRTRVVASGVVLLAVLGVGGGWAYEHQQQTTAVAALATAQDRQRALQAQQQSLAEVADVQAQAGALRTALASLMATDTPWSTVLDDLSRIRGGVVFTSVQGTADAPAAPGTTATPDAAVTTPGAVGRLVISGTAADKPTVAAFVEALAGVGGFADPFLSSVATASGSPTAGAYAFTVTVTLTGDLRTAATSRWSTGAAGATTTGGGK